MIRRFDTIPMGVVFAASVAALSACPKPPAGDECDLDDEPRVPVGHLEPCDAPPGYFVPAKDDCGYYECIEGLWGKGFPEQGCGGTLLPADPTAIFCPPYCLADVEPDPNVFTSLCSANPYNDGDELVQPVACDLIAGEWRVPSGSTACLAVSTGIGESPAVPETCAGQGLNAGIVLVGDIGGAIPPGYGLLVRCSYDTAPPTSCPSPGFLPEPAADACTDG